jgi:hypothetical protein
MPYAAQACILRAYYFTRLCHFSSFAIEEGAATGYWCYDEKGTQGIYTLLDQASEVGVELVVFGVNLNNTWRSAVANEFQSIQNITWFKNISTYAK